MPVKNNTAGIWDRAYLCVLAFILLASVGMTMATLRYGKNRVIIISDGRNYYIWARSIMLDGDIDFRNDYQLTHEPGDPFPPESAVRTPAGYVVNKYPIGMAILEVPGVLLGHAVSRYVTHSPTDGVSMPYQIAVAWSLIIFYFVSFFLLYRAMLSFGVSRMWAFGFSLMALVGTNLIHYVAKEPTMAHAAGVAVFNALLFLVAKSVYEQTTIHPARGVLIGVLVGLLFLVRNTNVLLLPVLAAFAWTRRRVLLREAIPILAASAVTAALQPLSLWCLWGRVRFSTYYNEAFTSGVSGVINALVSSRHGLLVYHPWYAVLFFFAALGALRSRKTRCTCIAAIASFLLVAVANGTWCCWWFGHSFGNRAFIESLPSLSTAAALVASQLPLSGRRRHLLVLSMATLVTVNVYLWLGYLLKGYPQDGTHTVSQAYLWLWLHSPASLIRHLAQ